MAVDFFLPGRAFITIPVTNLGHGNSLVPPILPVVRLVLDLRENLNHYTIH